MTTFTRGGSRKPSRLVKGLLVASIAFLTNCTPAGKYFAQGQLYDATRQVISSEIQKHQYEQERKKYQDDGNPFIKRGNVVRTKEETDALLNMDLN